MEYTCRLCSSNKLPKFDAFQTTFADHSLAYLINRYLYLNIEEEDNLPNEICLKCLEKVREVHKFAQLRNKVQQNFNQVVDKENMDESLPSANKETMENSVPLAAEKKAENLLKTVENVESPCKTPNQCPDEIKEREEEINLELAADDKKKDAEVKVPKDLILTIDSENTNIDESHGVKKDNTTDITVSKVEVATSSDHPSDNIIEISNTFLSGSNNQTEGDDSIIKNEINELSVTKLSDDTPKEKQYEVKCEYCPKSFANKKILKYHLLTHRDVTLYECPYCDHKNPVKYLLHQHINRCHSDSQYQCDVCKKVFLQRYSLFRHMFNHSDKKRYSCKVCKKGFIEKWQLKKHFKQKHKEGNNTHKCEICNKTFLAKRSLKNHMNAHGGIKPYSCPECNKAFSWRSSVSRHLARTHEKIKRYQCEICNKFISQKADMKRHIYAHLKLSEKLFMCEICGKTFTAKQSLGNHLKMHEGAKPYFCKICDKKFGWLKSLKRHEVNIHQNVEPYKCDICNKCLSQKSNLKHHIFLHLNLYQNPFKCHLCDKSYQRVGRLNKHMQKEGHQFIVEGDI